MCLDKDLVYICSFIVQYFVSNEHNMSPSPAVFQVFFWTSFERKTHVWARTLLNQEIVRDTCRLLNEGYKHAEVEIFTTWEELSGKHGGCWHWPAVGKGDSACRQDRKWRDIHSGFAFPNLRSECLWHWLIHHKRCKILAINLVSYRLGTWFSSPNRRSRNICPLREQMPWTSSKDKWDKSILDQNNSAHQTRKVRIRDEKYEIRIEMRGKYSPLNHPCMFLLAYICQ